MSEPLYPMLDPAIYLELAEELSSRSESYAKRTAADRAYYAAFLASRDCLTAKNYMTPYYDDRDHDYVVRTLKRRDVLGALGNDENRLRRARNCITYYTCDLTVDRYNDVRPLKWIIQTARDIIERVNALPPRS